MKSLQQYREFLLERGHPLSSLGLNESALRLDDALTAVALLAQSGVPVLGGDVYRMMNGAIVMTKDNWFSDQGSQESLERFVERSARVAESYLETYRGKKGDFLFTIVARGVPAEFPEE